MYRPHASLDLDGLPIKSIYPLSVLFATQGLNITLMNYAGNLDFGLVACPGQIPDLERLADYLDESYKELLEVAAIPKF